ncbi:4839_t:CDS:1, partial [Dentiscutata erythropus]
MCRVGQKLRLFSRRTPAMACYIEGGTLTDHSEELRLPHQLFSELLVHDQSTR